MHIEKTLETSTGHRLHNHSGKCSNLHGHNYQIKVTISFLNNNLKTIDNGQGYFIDFSDIKEIVNEFMDHKYLLFKDDPYLEQFSSLKGLQIVDFIPTAENISIHLRKIINEYLNQSMIAKGISHSVTIRMSETSSSYVESND